MNARYICQSPTEASEEPTSCIQNSEVHVPDPNWWKIAALQADCVLRRGSLQVKVREGSKFSSSGNMFRPRSGFYNRD
ncbi:uncharacterized protein LOC122084038 isoform X2 [Macadamia integrifolia]|uniref:uncharacterized protein LOC122084038 isoform X2 n=1 Tax=Macadamia integrifolia TaxID=60698 RepID=UPI001C4ED155|nr:uncharacterized protein LOC122084038 isoform X2 [Macadamia integrifolia]